MTDEAGEERNGVVGARKGDKETDTGSNQERHVMLERGDAGRRR